MEAVTEKGEDGEVLTEGVQSGTDRGESETDKSGRATAETGTGTEKETKAESTGRGVKTGSKGGAWGAETEGGSALVHPSRPIAQGLNAVAAWSKRRRIRKNSGRC